MYLHGCVADNGTGLCPFGNAFTNGCYRLKAALIQSSVVSAGLIAGKPAPTGVSPAFRHALYFWEPRLPAMGREAAPVTDVRFGSKAVLREWRLPGLGSGPFPAFTGTEKRPTIYGRYPWHNAKHDQKRPRSGSLPTTGWISKLFWMAFAAIRKKPGRPAPHRGHVPGPSTIDRAVPTFRWPGHADSAAT